MSGAVPLPFWSQPVVLMSDGSRVVLPFVMATARTSPDSSIGKAEH